MINLIDPIVLDVVGAVGDSICSEPVVRYAIKNLEGLGAKDVRIQTNYPKIFKHLNRPMGVSPGELGLNFGEFNHLFNRPEMIVDGKLIIHPLVQHAPPLLVHAVDFISMIMLRRTLPDEDKKIQLTFEDRSQELLKKIGQPLEELVLLHGGTNADNDIRNFPDDYNRNLQFQLQRAGLQVALIGKSGDRHPHPTKSYASTINLVDRLDWDELLTLISKCKVLVTNDSAPVHVAAAFDTWLVVLPTIRHPDRLIHVRQNQRYYKTYALFKKLILDDANEIPVYLYPRLDLDWSRLEPRRDEFLPDPEYVVDVVANRCVGTVGGINP